MSGAVAASSWPEFEREGWPDVLDGLARQPPMADYLRTLRSAGAWTVWASAASLVAHSREGVAVPLLRAIAAPKVFVFGARNRGAFTSEQTARRLGEVAFIPDAGHAMYTDNPAAFWQLVREFCARLVPAVD